jgi:uncharacterized membrane protein YeaQ/YmgE (transglycosylase-associated protein family)
MQQRRGEFLMSIIAWIIVGLIAGAIANIIYPGPSKGGWIGAMVLGIVGAIIGGFIGGLITGQDLVSGFNATSIIVAVIGALVLLFAFNAISRPRQI